MASGITRTIDAIDIQKPADLEYNLLPKELDDEPILDSGSLNVMGLEGGNIIKRPGFPQYANLPAIAGRIDRRCIYQTESDPLRIFILASVTTNGTSWKLWYIEPAGSGVWTSVGTLRNLDASTKPHEMVPHKGKVYIKGYPGSGDKYGSVVFDASGAGTPTTKIWGLAGPTVAARLAASGTWPASVHPVSVRLGWKYAYSWKTIDGHLSNRSPQETNPDQNQSNTGAFSNKRPRVVVQGHSDTTNVTKIIIWRTLDGGGVWLFLDEITNTGAGSITYEDNKRSSGSGNQDPKTDQMLNSANRAPSETSNDPPPPVNDPLVAGTDNVEKSTNIVSQNGRLWFAIRSTLFYSGLEEIDNGLPEHCWPRGFGGNYFNAGEASVAVENSPTGVVHFTTKNVYIVRGFSRDSFAHSPLLLDAGMSAYHPEAHCSYQDVVFWVTKDFRVCALVNEQMIVLSKPIVGDIEDRLNTTRELKMGIFAQQEKQLLCVLLADKVDSSQSIIWCYDLDRRKWNPPWQVGLTGFAFGTTHTLDQRSNLIGMSWNSSLNSSLISVLTFATKRDAVSAGVDAGYNVNITTSLMRVPIGNHMNPLRRPMVVPDVLGVVVHRRKYAGDTDPTVKYIVDDFGSGATFTAFGASDILADPPRRNQTTGFKEHWYMLQKAAQRVSVQITSTAADFDLQNLALIFRPEAGV